MRDFEIDNKILGENLRSEEIQSAAVEAGASTAVEVSKKSEDYEYDFLQTSYEAGELGFGEYRKMVRQLFFDLYISRLLHPTFGPRKTYEKLQAAEEKAENEAATPAATTGQGKVPPPVAPSTTYAPPSAASSSISASAKMETHAKEVGRATEAKVVLLDEPTWAPPTAEAPTVPIPLGAKGPSKVNTS